MALDLIAARLLCLDAFRGLAPEQIARVAGEAERMIFRDGQRLIETGKDGDGAILIIDGWAEALADEDLGLEAREIEAGTLLGETAMLTEHQFRLTVVARGDVKAVQITRAALLAHMHDDPSLAEHLQRRLASRLQRVIVELRLIDERLATAGELAATEAASEAA